MLVYQRVITGGMDRKFRPRQPQLLRLIPNRLLGPGGLMSADGAADGGGWGRFPMEMVEMDILDIATGLFLFRICGFLMPAKMRIEKEGAKTGAFKNYLSSRH